MTKLPLTLALTNISTSLHHTEGRKFILEFYIYTYVFILHIFFFSAVVVKISKCGESFAFAVIFNVFRKI